jgi:hypothetical protein
MTPKFQDGIANLLGEWIKERRKEDHHTVPNINHMYPEQELAQFLDTVEDWTLYGHCIEDHEAMDKAHSGKRVVAEIQIKKGLTHRIYNDNLEKQIEVDERRKDKDIN